MNHTHTHPTVVTWAAANGPIPATTATQWRANGVHTVRLVYLLETFHYLNRINNTKIATMVTETTGPQLQLINYTTQAVFAHHNHNNCKKHETNGDLVTLIITGTTDYN